jgi:glycyl-tRNA synthetase beta subunit
MSILTMAMELSEISDEEKDAFSKGWNAALSAILSDATYYNALDAKNSLYHAVEKAVEFVKD